MISASDILQANILIVDDQPANVSLLEKMLRAAGYTAIASTQDPFQVCELQRLNRYTLIVLDLQMPGMDGFEVMEGLKAIETEDYLPVLVVTAQPAHKLRALKAGARDFVSKPFDLAEVLMRVRNLIEVRLLHVKSKALYDQIVVEQQAAAQLLHIFRSGPVAVSIKTVANERVIDANEEHCRFFGYTREQIVGRSALDFNMWEKPQERALVMSRLLRDGAVRGFETKKRRSSGELRDVLISLELIELAGEKEPVFISMFTDITVQRHLENQVRQSQKMDAIGQLAGGIAHDFNNILGAIVGYTDLAAMFTVDNPVVSKHLESVSKASRRAVDLVKQILNFSRQGEQARQVIHPNEVIGEALKLLRATMPTSIQFEIRLPDTPTILADATAIHQIIMNLGTNACHAMKGGAGTLTIELVALEIDAEFAATQLDLKAGHYVKLSVADTGCGMDRATVQHIFEPFFTTKAAGEGTGLGLAVVHGIMRSHDGGISVLTQPGQGTTFQLYFPVFEAVTKVSFVEQFPIPRGMGQRILFVDDEAPLVEFGETILARLGYAVTTKTSVAEALITFREQPDAFDLVITDLTMPGLDGTGLARQLLELKPGLAIILTTGYSGTMNAESARQQGFRDFMIKPNTARSLGEAVHRALQMQTEHA